MKDSWCEMQLLYVPCNILSHHNAGQKGKSRKFYILSAIFQPRIKVVAYKSGTPVINQRQSNPITGLDRL